MIGGTMTVLLKEWMIDHQRVSQMEKVHVLSEVEQLKEQVSPELFSKHYIIRGTDIERTGKSLEDADEIKSTTSLSTI